MTSPLALLAQQRWDGHPMHGWDGGWMWLWGSLMMLTWVAIIAAAVWLVIRANHANRGNGDTNDTTGAKRVLDERLARGEITIDEYRDRREAMR
jgi:putative membrane protein